MTKIFFADNYKIGEHTGSFDSIIDEKIFTTNGLHRVMKIKECDLIIAGRLSCEITHSKRPVIICERYDSSSIGVSYWYYSSPQVKSIFKNYIPRDIKVLTKPTILKRYHYNQFSSMVNIEDRKLEDNERTIDYINKFRLVVWKLSYTHLSQNKHMKWCIDNYKQDQLKTNEIFGVFHDHSGILKDYRIKVRQAISILTSKYSCIIGNSLDQASYHNGMLKSKIVIAPWGLGERVAADQKAILCGCILIKPDTNFVLTYPDLYDDKYYVKCKSDFSDLEHIVEDVLNNYDTYLARSLNARQLFNDCDRNCYIQNFCDQIKDVVTNNI